MARICLRDALNVLYRCLHCRFFFFLSCRFIISSSRLIINGEEVWQPRLVPALASDAVPTQFPNVPKYLSKTLPKERKRKSRAPLQEPNRKARTLCQPSQLQSSQQYQQQTQEASSVYGDCDSPSGSLTAKTSTFRNLRRPSDYWSEQLFSEEPNTVSYQTVCLSNNTVPPLKFERAVIFEAQTAEGPSVCKVFLRGIPHLESSVGTPSQAEDILRYVDNVPLCAGVGELTEFAVVKIQEKSCQRVENKLYSNKCNGSVLGETFFLLSGNNYLCHVRTILQVFLDILACPANIFASS